MHTPKGNRGADMLLLQVELQEALGDRKKTFSETELLEHFRSLWIQEHKNSGSMLPSEFPLSVYVDRETGEIRLDEVKKLARHIKEANEQKMKEIGPLVQQILEKRR